MRLESGEELLTIKDIAECIAFGTSEIAVTRTLRQVRHWTQNDLLKTVSEKSTGKGMPRFYLEEPTLQIAAILVELSRYGVTLEVLKPVADELYDDWDEGGFYLLTSTTDTDTYIQVSWVSDPESGRITGAKTKLFDEKEIDEEESFDPTPSSSVLINMTQVMERVFSKKLSSDEGSLNE